MLTKPKCVWYKMLKRNERVRNDDDDDDGKEKGEIEWIWREKRNVYDFPMRLI